MNAVICGVGNRLRGDDACGPLAAGLLKKERLSGTIVFDCASAPENFIGKIAAASPEIVVVIDAVEMDKPAGFAEKITPERVAGIIYSTHNAPLALFFKAVQAICKNVVFIGIQPKKTEFGKKISAEAKKGTADAAAIAKATIQP